MNLRPYQRDCVEAVLSAIDPFDGGYSRVLYTQPTGCGKTVTFAELTRRLLEQKHQVLILAHRTELIGQAYNRVLEYCGLHEWDIGMEIGESRADRSCRVIVGSVQTCYRPNRLPEGWKPTVIITDEGHHAAAKGSYQKIYERFDVGSGKCIHIACTATAKRTDRLCLYALDVHGEQVMLKHKSGKVQAADPDEAVFEKHVYDFTVMDAIEGGWLVPIRGHTVETTTDINDVKTVGGDFVEGQLARKVDNLERTKAAISAWKKIAIDRPTLVFCASVEHAHHAAELWRQAGYTTDAVDGTTEGFLRFRMFEDFKAGKLQVLCNMGIATEGVDLPNCACIVHLRPTKSWNLYLQMCLDAETEILTSHGWKGMGNIKKGDCVPTLNMETSKGQWSRVLSTVERDMEEWEQWVEYDAPRANFRVTDQHNMIFSTANGRQHVRTPWTLKTAGCMVEHERNQLRMPTAVQIDQSGVPLTDSELYFIGMMMTDGTWTEYQGTLFQSERYPQIMTRIEECLSACGFTWRKIIDDCPSNFKSGFTRWRYVISAGKTRSATGRIPPYLRGTAKARDPRSDWQQGHTGFRHLMPYLDKDFAPALMALSKPQLLVLIRAIHDGDGMKLENADYKPQGWRFCSARRQFVDRIQALAAMNGYMANLSAEQGQRTNPIYYLTITPKDWRSIGGSGETRPHVQMKPSTQERVWCIETETGTIITRRHGKVTVMGNSGRCTRVWPGILDAIQDAVPEVRQEAIKNSPKPDSIIIDLVDIFEKCGDLCGVPSILDLPVNLDLEGHSLTDAKKLLDEFDENRERVIGECPTTFKELSVKLHQVNLMRGSGAKTEQKWKATDEGYRYTSIQPGYTCDLNRNQDGYVLRVEFKGQKILEIHGKPGLEMKAYLDKAAQYAAGAIKQHSATRTRGTLMRLSPRQVGCLKANGHDPVDIDCMTWYKARALIEKYMKAWKTRREHAV